MSLGPAEPLFAGVEVVRDAETPMRDGTILRSDVYRPTSGGPHPVLVLRTPYDKRLAQTIVYKHPAWYAARGYIAVAQDVRGRYASDGDFEPFHHEAEDGFDTIEWAAELPGSTGAVGTYGFSYPGAVQLQAAALRPRGLACVAPGFAVSDFYEDWIYTGGAFQLAGTLSWVVAYLAIADAVKRGRPAAAERLAKLAGDFGALYAAEPVAAAALERDDAPYLFDWLEHDTWDDYWRGISIRERYDDIDVPCLHVGGWYDIFIEGTVRNFEELSRRAAAEQRLYLGPWVHIPWASRSGCRDFGEEARNSVDEAQLRWFDRWLRDGDALPDEERVRVFYMGDDRWESHGSWPPEDVRAVEWFLDSRDGATSLSGDGRLVPEPPPGERGPDVFAYHPENPVPSRGGHSCCTADIAPMGPADQRDVEMRNDVLVYSSEPLEQDLVVAGTVELTLFAQTDAPSTDWTAKLVDVSEDGSATNVCDSIVRVRDTSPEVAELTIRVGTTAQVFKAGHRIRLEVSSSNWPHYDANPNTGAPARDAVRHRGAVATQIVHHSAKHPSRLRLPARAA